jgi:SM-20-related protein
LVIVANCFNKIPPYGLVNDWLGPETVERLLRFAQSNEHVFKDTRVGQEGGRIDPTVRRSKLTKLGELKSELQVRVQAALPSMFERLGGAPFEPVWVELEMVAHGDGALFTKHIDTSMRPNGTSNRAISAVYYFHRLPKSFSGGVLRLHSLVGSGSFVDIEPTNDSLVFFPSWFPHEVMPVTCPSGRFEDSRFAINCWVHRAMAAAALK